MNKKVNYNFTGANQDFSQTKHPAPYYFEAGHIRLLATDKSSTGSATNEKGNSQVVVIPNIDINDSTNVITYGTKTLSYTNGTEISRQIDAGILPITSTTQKIIGHATTREGVILFTTDDLGVDCIWAIENILDDSYDLDLVYIRNIGFTINGPIQAIFNYENQNIQKVYWVDGLHQIRSINITHNEIKGESFRPALAVVSEVIKNRQNKMIIKKHKDEIDNCDRVVFITVIQ